MATDDSMLKVVLRFADLYAAEFERRIAALEITVERLTVEGRLDEAARARRKLGQYEISRSQLFACANSVRASLATESPPVESQPTLAITSPTAS
jgi:hypothetical protein